MSSSIKIITIIGIVYLVAIIPVSYIIPISWAWENGPIEDAQAVVLFIGFIMSLKYASHARLSGMWYTAATCFLLMTGRELSWGRVFFPLPQEPGSGPSFIDMVDVPHHELIYAAIGLVLIFALYGFVRKVQWRMVKKYMPWPSAVLCIVFIVIQYMAEHHIFFDHAISEPLEELGELYAYILLVAITSYLHENIENGRTYVGKFYRR